MFQNCANTKTIRESAAVAVTTDAIIGSIQDQNTGAFIWVITTTGYSVGTLGCQPVGSFDGGTTYVGLGDDLGEAVTSDGITYITMDGPVPEFFGLRLTPIGGFDGLVQVVARSSGRYIGIPS